MKYFQGKVISDKMQKTVTVLVERKFRHPFYGKVMERGTKVHARNLLGAKVGDLVKVAEVKPFAKTVSLKVVEVYNNEGNHKEKDIKGEKK